MTVRQSNGTRLVRALVGAAVCLALAGCRPDDKVQRFHDARLGFSIEFPGPVKIATSYNGPSGVYTTDFTCSEPDGYYYAVHFYKHEAPLTGEQLTRAAEEFNKTQPLWPGGEAAARRNYAVRFNNFQRGEIPVVERFAFNNDGNTHEFERSSRFFCSEGEYDVVVGSSHESDCHCSKADGFVNSFLRDAK